MHLKGSCYRKPKTKGPESWGPVKWTPVCSLLWPHSCRLWDSPGWAEDPWFSWWIRKGWGEPGHIWRRHAEYFQYDFLLLDRSGIHLKSLTVPGSCSCNDAIDSLFVPRRLRRKPQSGRTGDKGFLLLVMEPSGWTGWSQHSPRRRSCPSS
jgi:hypothetical protein